MASVFTRIYDGELPARVVWRDDQCVAFLDIAPLKPGHTIVVPRLEVDHWLDLDADVAHHLLMVAQTIGKALQQGFKPVKVALVILGLAVPHAHLHLVPVDHPHDLDYGNVNGNPDPDELDRAAAIIRRELRALGCPQVVDGQD